MKTCTKCGETKALEALVMSRGKPRSFCKACKSAYDAACRAANPEKFSARSAAWNAANAEKVAAYQAAYRAAYYPANFEKIAARRADYVASLSASYLSSLLGIPTAQLTPELLELKREQLSLRRLARQLKKAANESIDNDS